MRKIINGKKYDTETATKIIGNSSDELGNDFGFSYERLYRKKTGEFFLHGSGGPLSKWGKWTNGTRTYSEDIVPFSEAEAKEWVEENANDLYEKLFGEVGE